MFSRMLPPTKSSWASCWTTSWYVCASILPLFLILLLFLLVIRMATDQNDTKRVKKSPTQTY